MGRLTDKLRNKHLLSLVSNGLMAVMGLVTFAVLNRVLSLNDNGSWIVFQSTFILADTFRTGFLSTAFVKFYVGKTHQQALGVAGSAWYIALGITLVFLVFSISGLLFSDAIPDAGFSLFVKWCGVTFLASLPYLMATCLLQAQERFDRLLILRVVNQITFFGAIVTLYFMVQFTLVYVVYAYIFSFLVSSLFALVMGWAKLMSIAHKNRQNIKELYHFGKYSVGTILSTNLFRTIDVYIINLFLTPAAVAIYNLALRLLEVIEIPLRSLTASGMPMMVKAFNEGKPEDVIGILRKFAGSLTLAMAFVVLSVLLLADVPIALLGGGKFIGTEAANVFRGFMVIALLYPADRFMAVTLDVIHRPKVNFYKILLMLAVNLVADFVAVYYMGNIYGIVVAGFFPVLVAVLVGYCNLQSYYKFSFASLYTGSWQNLKIQAAQLRNRKN